MSDFKYKGTLGGVSPETKEFAVAAGAVGSIVPGKVIVVSAGFATLVANGGADAVGRYAFTVSTSTDTVSTDGTVLAVFCPSGLLIEGKATVPGNLVPTLEFNRVTMSVSGGIQTVNESDPTGVMTIISYDNAVAGNTVVSLPWEV